MKVPDIIFLCGFMGTGKTTIGQKVSSRLERPFLDLDDRIIERANKSIPEIFESGGEEEFRTVERQALMEVCRNFEGIVALGGGSLQNQHLLDHLKLNGLLIFLETPFSILMDRIYQDTNRPLLLDEQGNVKEREALEEELRFLYDDRLPLYRQAAISIRMEAGESPDEQVEILMKKIRNHVA
jgi:shikimate kinase